VGLLLAHGVVVEPTSVPVPALPQESESDVTDQDMLVKELRYYASSRMDREGRLMRMAAEEIERLRRELDKPKPRGW
jgi:hypothetical protein